MLALPSLDYIKLRILQMQPHKVILQQISCSCHCLQGRQPGNWAGQALNEHTQRLTRQSRCFWHLVLDWHHAQIAHSPLTLCTYGSRRGRSDPSSSQPSAAAELDKIRGNAASVGDTLNYLADNFEGFDDDLEQLYEDASAVSRSCLAGLLHSRNVVSRVSTATRRVTATPLTISSAVQACHKSFKACASRASSDLPKQTAV